MNSTQIAKLAGVSRSTVSKVLHNYKGIPEETRQKVLKVIKEYDYKPNTMSQAALKLLLYISMRELMILRPTVRI